MAEHTDHEGGEGADAERQEQVPATDHPLVARETDESASLSLARPGGWRRGGCAILDGLILGFIGCVFGCAGGVGLALVFMVAKGGAQLQGDSAARHMQQDPWFLFVTQGVFPLIAAGITLGYFTLFHGYQAQTPGKMAGRMKVVMGDGRPITLKAAWLRALVFAGPQALPPLPMLVTPLIGGAAMGLNGLLTLAFLLYVVANIFTAIGDFEQHRAIHDRAAGTRVVLMPK